MDGQSTVRDENSTTAGVERLLSLHALFISLDLSKNEMVSGRFRGQAGPPQACVARR